jgi:hypothetical protein
MSPPHPHAGVNFVQPSPVQQYQNFKQLNTENLTHSSNNAKNKGRNRNNNNLGQGRNQPQQNQPTGGNPNQGNQNPQGGNNNRHQGRNNNNVKTNFPCALCGDFDHYTHHCPQITDFKRLKDSGSLPHPPAPRAPQQAPQQYVQQHPPPPYRAVESYPTLRCDKHPKGHETSPTSGGTVPQPKQSSRSHDSPH